MLRNISSTVPSRLLTRLTTLTSGQWIAITSRPVPNRADSVTVDSPLEETISAIFTALPVSDATDTPLVGWLGDPANDAGLDAFFTVQGLARDIERRPLEMGRLRDLPDDPWQNVAAVVTVPAATEFVFFVCVGHGEQTPVTLFGARQHLAA